MKTETTNKHFCWYRITQSKRTDRSLNVGMVAAWKPNHTMPTKEKVEQGRHYTAKTVRFDIDEIYIACLRSIGSSLIAKAKQEMGKLGLEIRYDHVLDLPEMVKYMTMGARHVSSVNFLWIDVTVPYRAGQKKLTQTVANFLTDLQKEFADALTIEFEMSVL